MEPMTFETPDGLQLELRIPAGEIVVRAVDTTETRLEIRGERDPEGFRISCEPIPTGGHRLTVDQRQRNKVFGWGGGELRVDVTVPEAASVDAQSGSADLEVTGTVDSLSFKSGSGDCRFDGSRGSVSIKTASGDLSGASVGGSLSFHSASGDARVRSVSGRVVGRTASGNIALGSAEGSVEVTSVSGDVEIASVVTGLTTVKAVSGDAEIGVAPGTRVYLDLSSTSGETVSELDGPGDGSQTGPAELELHVGTVSGDIRIYRAAEIMTPRS